MRQTMITGATSDLGQALVARQGRAIGRFGSGAIKRPWTDCRMRLALRQRWPATFLTGGPWPRSLRSAR